MVTESESKSVPESLLFRPPVHVELEDRPGVGNNFCKFVTHALGTNTNLVSSCISARMAALNTVAKLLGKNFDDPKNHAEYEEFCRRR